MTKTYQIMMANGQTFTTRADGWVAQNGVLTFVRVEGRARAFSLAQVAWWEATPD